MSFHLDLDNLFTYHRPIGDQPERYQEMRAAGKALAKTIIGLSPPSPEQTMAIRRVQEAVMWANAAIACNEKAVEVDLTKMEHTEFSADEVSMEVRGSEVAMDGVTVMAQSIRAWLEQMRLNASQGIPADLVALERILNKTEPQDGWVTPQEAAHKLMQELCAVTGDDYEHKTWIQMLHTVRMLKEDAEKYRDLNR